MTEHRDKVAIGHRSCIYLAGHTGLVGGAILRGLRTRGYGLIALVSALTGYLGLVDMGLGVALVRYLAYHRALGQGRPMIAILRVAVVWFNGAGYAAVSTGRLDANGIIGLLSGC